MSVSDTLVLVEMGELIQGTIDKRTVGNGQTNNNTHNSNSRAAAVEECSEQRMQSPFVHLLRVCLSFLLSCFFLILFVILQPKTL